MVREMQQQRYSNYYESSQGDDFDGEAFLVDFDAIIRAPIQPVSVERQFAGVLLTLDRLTVELGLTPLAANDDPRQCDPELEEIAASFDDMTPVIVMRHDVPANANEEAWLVELDARRSVAELPKKRVARPRTSQARDRRIVHILPGFSADARQASPSSAGGVLVDAPLSSLSPLSAPSKTLHPHNENTPSKSTIKRRLAAENDNRRAPNWDRTTDIAKGHAYARAVSVNGPGLAWTLNLGGKVLKAANDNPKAFKAWMHDRLMKAFKASPLGARDFLSALEVTPAGRIHMHGIADANLDELEALKAVLTHAGGLWSSSHHSARQADAAVIWNADGWMRYLAKDHARTKAALGVKSVLSATTGCRQRAKALWQACR